MGYIAHFVNKFWDAGFHLKTKKVEEYGVPYPLQITFIITVIGELPATQHSCNSQQLICIMVQSKAICHLSCPIKSLLSIILHLQISHRSSLNPPTLLLHIC